MQCVVPQVTHFAEALPLVKAVWTDNKGSDNPRRDSFFSMLTRAMCHVESAIMKHAAINASRAWKG